ncbi:ABC transporter ATP-binding protein [Mycetocola reblochoni]|uniref:ABC transporter, ATP-binding protein n=2 Tax=Mycetocola reblochoni TaxID=331618 RepID=A0A1R4IN42_9MICO|nr:ABC transporter ATP-binding protein [Mycetocola reblochoni]RLP67916.1 ABC transporter ATP-binding protein [Mycetocola reblochoni]SJN21168.1 ABC transporter, ATP-binding protein [Mycetocola reblochoni REB411]
MTPSILTAHRLLKSYDRAPAPALDEVSIQVAAGESVAIMGPSGSGKTTLLHALAGIVPVDAGQVTFHGPTGAVEVSSLSESRRSALRRDHFGFVFQQGLLIPELTAVENVSLPLLLAGYRRQDAESRAASWLDALGLAGMGGRRIGELSGGQAQRVAIARAQVTGASIVFADEPTGALDSATSVEVLDALLGSTVGQGRTLVVVTHDEDVAARCARIVRLRDGRIRDDSAPRGAAATGGPRFAGAGWSADEDGSL